VNGCSARVVVGVQVGWEKAGKNFLLVIGVVHGDEGSLERDVSAANRRAHVEDRDCCLRFLRRLLCLSRKARSEADAWVSERQFGSPVHTPISAPLLEKQPP
jgi:hypothetical protein